MTSVASGMANTLQQTEENVGEGAHDSLSSDGENVFDDVWKVSEFWRTRVKSQLHQVGILPNAAGKNDNASADASGDGMIEQSLSLVNSKISESDMDESDGERMVASYIPSFKEKTPTPPAGGDKKLAVHVACDIKNLTNKIEQSLPLKAANDWLKSELNTEHAEYYFK